MPPTKRQIENLCRTFKVLGDPTRLKIIQILGNGEMNVSQICRKFRGSQPTISRHLGILRMMGLVESRRKGKEIFYCLPDKTKRKMKSLLDKGFNLVT